MINLQIYTVQNNFQSFQDANKIKPFYKRLRTKSRHWLMLLFCSTAGFHKTFPKALVLNVYLDLAKPLSFNCRTSTQNYQKLLIYLDHNFHSNSHNTIALTNTEVKVISPPEKKNGWCPNRKTMIIIWDITLILNFVYYPKMLKYIW